VSARKSVMRSLISLLAFADCPAVDLRGEEERTVGRSGKEFD
jgi:hypothetical protein